MNRAGVWRRLAWWASLVGLITLAIPVFSRATGVEAGPLALLVAFMPWATLAAAFVMVLTLLARSWVLGAASVVLAALCVAWQLPLFLGGGGGGEPVLTVATVNMTVGEADADAVVAMVRSRHVDVLAAVELTPDAAARLAEAGLNLELPYRKALPEQGVPGTGVWSRYPLADVEDVPGLLSHAISASVAAPAGAFTMLAVHPRSPGWRNQAPWRADLAALRDVLEGVEGPVVVAGDFNTTRDHAGFRAIESLGYVDAADRIDAGFQPTFPENRELFPLVAIDHVLTRDAPLRPATFETVVIPGADHRALVVAYAASGGS